MLQMCINGMAGPIESETDKFGNQEGRICEVFVWYVGRSGTHYC